MNHVPCLLHLTLSQPHLEQNNPFTDLQNGMLVSSFTMNMKFDGSGHKQFQGMILALYWRDWEKYKNLRLRKGNGTADSNLELPNWQSSCSVCWQQIKHKIKISHLQYTMQKDKWKISYESHKNVHPPTANTRISTSKFNSKAWIWKIQPSDTYTLPSTRNP
jgi:hypothetical protein